VLNRQAVNESMHITGVLVAAANKKVLKDVIVGLIDKTEPYLVQLTFEMLSVVDNCFQLYLILHSPHSLARLHLDKTKCTLKGMYFGKIDEGVIKIFNEPPVDCHKLLFLIHN